MTRSLPQAEFDTECYPNYWLLKFKPRGDTVRTFRLLSGQSFTQLEIGIMSKLFQSYSVRSFNGLGYDVPMVTAAMLGYTPERLKQLNDMIIVDGMKPWQLNLPEWAPADHIDVMEVAPGAGSQKQYAGRIHYKTMRDLPYEANTVLTAEQMGEVDIYCENDLGQLAALVDELEPQIKQREVLSERYGIDLRSKSDAQVAEAVLKKRCEQATGKRIYKNDVNWNMRFKYNVPDFINFSIPQLVKAFEIVRDSEFGLDYKGSVKMPDRLEGLEIIIGNTAYKIGIGGLHSKEKRIVHKSDDNWALFDNDVASYYPSLILNSGEWPQALGPTFLSEYNAIKNERLDAKHKQAELKKSGDTSSKEYETAKTGNEGGKIMINGTFGKTGSQYSVLFAPTMLIQTTITGQLSLLMLIEWHELCGIPVVSANTDGIITKCPRNKIGLSKSLIEDWQKLTGLEMETVEYRAIYSRDVNNYFAVKTNGEVKRKGEYSRAGLIEKKNPFVEICADAVELFLANGTPIEHTISLCWDIRKFVVVKRVSGGAVKLWGEGVVKGTKVRDMIQLLEQKGWEKEGRKWKKDGMVMDARSAYQSCFPPQIPEYLGKVVRWYYSKKAPGPIVYKTNGNTVSLSYGAKPCMTLPDTFPTDIDYDWYFEKAYSILHDIGYYDLKD
jgi:hypothetical protein